MLISRQKSGSAGHCSSSSYPRSGLYRSNSAIQKEWLRLKAFFFYMGARRVRRLIDCNGSKFEFFDTLRLYDEGSVEVEFDTDGELGDLGVVTFSQRLASHL